MPNRIAAFLAAGVMAVGLSAAPANATAVPKPSVTVADGCAPLSLNNPTRWGAQVHYRVVGNRAVGPVAVPGHSKVQRDLRPRYGAGTLPVQWWARSHDWRAKAKAVRAAERTRDDAKNALDDRRAAVTAAVNALSDFEKTNPRPVEFKDNTWQQELERLKDDQRPVAQQKVGLINAFLNAENAVPATEGALREAQAKLGEAKAASYWTRWHRGLVRVPECVTPTPTPTATDEPTPTPDPSVTPTDDPTEEPTEEPEPQPTVTETRTTTKVVVVGNVRVPGRVDTGAGGLVTAAK